MCAYRRTSIGGWTKRIGPTWRLVDTAITKDEGVGLTACGQGCLVLEECSRFVRTEITSTGNTGHGKGFVIDVYQGRGGSVAVYLGVCGLEGKGRGIASSTRLREDQRCDRGPR